MKTRGLGILVVGILLVGLLAGCTTTAASRVDLGGLPNADHPEYMTHPLRLISAGLNVVGNVMQYTLVEPTFFVLAPVPELVGLSLEERRYLEQRREAWRQYLAGERPAVQ